MANYHKNKKSPAGGHQPLGFPKGFVSVYKTRFNYMTTQHITAQQISVKYPLTEKPQARSLKNVPGHDTGHNFKQTNGGNVTNYQPPHMRGFFMPATFGDCTLLPSVARNKKPAGGNTCSVSIWTLEGTRQFYNCCNFKQSNEVNANA